jgi:hypothetical protein
MNKFYPKSTQIKLFYPDFILQKGVFRKHLFCETLIFRISFLFVYLKYSFPNSQVFGILLMHIFIDFHKTGGYLMSGPDILFDPADLPSPIRYKTLFESLPEIKEPSYKTGRKPISRNCLFRACIYKALRRLATLSDLTFELNNNPTVSKSLGFDPLVSAPSVERFSSFLHELPNEVLQTAHHKLVNQLITDHVISGKILAMDSCPIVVALKENNLKTSMKDRFDKTQIPHGDPDARLGIMIHYPNPFQKKVRYFWGYRNHILSDTFTELPIWELTKPANVHENKIAKFIIQDAKKAFDLEIDSIIGDANYDTEDLLTFIIKDLKARAIIPRNPRKERFKGYQIKGDKVLCEANLPMYRRGKMRPKRAGILYQQYSCPINYDSKIRHQYIVCPIFHPKFFKGKGCNALIRLEPSIRQQMDYGTLDFKELYNTRTSVERVFSRLLSIAMQNPTVRGLQAVRNHVTIAHIAVLLIALTAYNMGYKNKIRFVKSFVPNFMV